VYGTSDPELVLRKYTVIRRTPKGAWIREYGRDRFVLLTARKRFACNTKDEALESFIARKEAQIRKLRGQLKKAKADLALGLRHKEAAVLPDEVLFQVKSGRVEAR